MGKMMNKAYRNEIEARLLKIVLAEESHVKRKQQDKYENVKRLPKESRRNFGLSFRYASRLPVQTSKEHDRFSHLQYRHGR